MVHTSPHPPLPPKEFWCLNSLCTVQRVKLFFLLFFNYDYTTYCLLFTFPLDNKRKNCHQAMSTGTQYPKPPALATGSKHHEVIKPRQYCCRQRRPNISWCARGWAAPPGNGVLFGRGLEKGGLKILRHFKDIFHRNMICGLTWKILYLLEVEFFSNVGVWKFSIGREFLEINWNQLLKKS